MSNFATTPVQVERNNWQHISDATNTVVTPANMLDAVGFVGAKWGIDHLETWPGIAVAGGSYAVDVIDGKVARATQTQSELGEAVDAAGDKVKLAYALIKIAKQGLAPKSLVAAVTLQNTFNAGVTLIDRKVNPESPVVHPSWCGKRAMFLQQIGLGVNVVGAKMENDNIPLGKTVRSVANVAGFLGVALGVVASVDYAHKLIDSQR